MRETHRGGKTKEKRIARNLPVAPSYAGPKTFPNYNAVAAGAVASGRRVSVRPLP